MNKFTPLVKGLITGLVMLAIAVALSFVSYDGNEGWSYIIYAIYAAGVIWTLIDYSKSEAYTGKFGAIFAQGFRCFVVVTLIMVAFTFIYSMQHPEYAEKSAIIYKEELVKREKNRTPAEIDKEVATFKKGYTTAIVSTSIFGYLVLGVFFTAAGAGILLMRRK
jgi:Protein of unknown function (DUF4199)